MPKYFADKVCGHWLYFTAHCIAEAMHAHASRDSKLQEKGAAKFFVYADGSSKMTAQGTLTDRDVPEIRAFIKQHYKEMFAKWSERSSHGYYGQPGGSQSA